MSAASWSEGSAHGVLVHGGAGSVPEAKRGAHAEGCRLAARAAWAVIDAGGTALDAVARAAQILEDDPLFNAGFGAALDADGEVAHDAAIACGATLRVGAVCALRGFRNPVFVAREVLEDGRHVLLAAEGARRFALERGVASVDPASLVTEAARERLAAVLAGRSASGWAGGTIGAVARDRSGAVAAATSTGGTVGKRPGRVGDSPIVGAGTLAEHDTVALSATGDGEGILRVGLAHRVADALVARRDDEAVLREALARMQERTGATGGLIVARAAGGFAWARSTDTMSWAFAGDGGEVSGA